MFIVHCIIYMNTHNCDYVYAIIIAAAGVTANAAVLVYNGTPAPGC